jgi:hypothetical protein
MAFWLANDFPRGDFGPVDFIAFRWFAAALAGVTFLRIFIDRPQALRTATAVAGGRMIRFLKLWEPIEVRYTDKSPSGTVTSLAKYN